jgi:flagellar biosynthesis protein FlhB
LFVGAVALAGVAVGVLQTRGLFQPMQLARGLESYRVGAFVGRLRHNLVDAALGGVRACVVVAFLFPLVWLFLERAPLAWEDLSAASLSLYGDLLKGLWMRGGMALVAIAGVGYALARWQFLRKHRMSLQEMKEEHRDDEGDQHTKALRKHEHRAMLFSEVEKRVRRSKVVIVRRGT